MIVFVAAKKGGAGRFTIISNIAVHLVHQNADVVPVNTDGQVTCARFSEQRDEAGIDSAVPYIQWTGDVTVTLRDLSRRYQVIVVDAGGRDSHEIQSAMAVSNLLLVPTHASQADLETLPKVNELIGLTRGLSPGLKALTVLSVAPSDPAVREVGDAREVLSQFDQLELADTIIRGRKVYHDALLNGNRVVELNNSRACVEIQLFVQGFLEVAAQA